MRDCDIRQLLRRTELSKFLNDPHSKVVEELSISYGDAIIDLAVINGALHGFEIKSEYDTLNRLPNQMSAYCKTFDYLTVISGKKHLSQLLEMVPEWCGIMVVNSLDNGGENYLTYVRKPKKNSTTDKYSIAQLLWREEALDVLRDLGISKGIKSKPKPALWRLLANIANKKTLSQKVREKLKIRVNWKSEQRPFENDGYSPLFAKL